MADYVRIDVNQETQQILRDITSDLELSFSQAHWATSLKNSVDQLRQETSEDTRRIEEIQAGIRSVERTVSSAEHAIRERKTLEDHLEDLRAVKADVATYLPAAADSVSMIAKETQRLAAIQTKGQELLDQMQAFREELSQRRQLESALKVTEAIRSTIGNSLPEIMSRLEKLEHDTHELAAIRDSLQTLERTLALLDQRMTQAQEGITRLERPWWKSIFGGRRS